MKPIIKLALISGVALALYGWHASSWAKSESKDQTTTPVLEEAPSYTLAAPGRIEPMSEERQIGSEVIGTLKEVLVNENDSVKAGQVIAIINNGDQTALLTQARAQLLGATARLKLAELDYERQSTLYKQKTSSAAARDSALAQLDSAKADVQSAEASVALAQANLDKTFIKSPIDGIILKKFVVAGGAVSNQPPTAIAVIGDVSQLNVRAEVDELDIGKVHVGQKVAIKADAYPDKVTSGTVIRVNRRIGARAIQTDRSDEKTDNKVLEVLARLDDGASLPINLRVDVFFKPER